MKTRKKIVLLVLALTLSLGIFAFASNAATSEQELKAKALWSLDLFKGYDSTGTNFGLGDTVKREQALTFLVRMLGEEPNAQKWSGEKPYTDIAAGDWSIPYVGYAKKSGYTNGVGDNKFGYSKISTKKEMVVFALRGLGYSDSIATPDFTWANAMTVAKEKGIITSTSEAGTFTRGNAVDIIFNSLAVNIKGKDYDLLSKLMNMGVVTQAQYDAAMKILENKSGSNLADGSYTMSCQGKYLRVNSGKLEIRDTKPAQVFTVIANGNYSYIKTSDGKYLTLTSTADGTQLSTSSTPYQWLIRQYSGSKYTIRPVAKTSLIVNANSQATSNGTKMIVWPHSDSPSNAQITITAATKTSSSATFKLYNKTGKTISEIYIADSDLATNYSKEYLSSYNKTSLSNNSYFNITLSFYSDTAYDVYVRFTDGTEYEAQRLSFAKATTSGGSININSSNITLYSGSTSIASAALTKKSTDYTAQTTQLKTRYNTSVTKYNKLLEECKKYKLNDDAEFVKEINTITDAINSLGKTLGSVTTLTSSQISECTRALDQLDSFINNIDTLLKKETAVSEKIITIYNFTGTPWTGLYSTSVLHDSWGSNLLSGTVTNSASVKINFSYSGADSKFDLKTTYSGGELIFQNIDIAGLANNSSFYLYMENNKPVVSTTKPTFTREISVTIINNTNKTFSEMYSTESTNSDFGTDNLLSGNVSSSVVIIFPVSNQQSIYDIRFVDSANEYYDIYKVDFSNVKSKATIELRMENGKIVWEMKSLD